MSGIWSIVLAFAIAAPSQKGADLAAVDDFISNRKYASAFRMLDEKDPRNEDPARLEKKISLALGFSAATVMHRSFTFIDLGPGQDLDDYNITPEAFNPYNAYDFQIDAILRALIRKKPGNARLHFLLGDFYFRMQRQYGDTWFVGGEELLRLAGEAFALADKGKGLDRSGLDEYALVSAMQKNYTKAVSLYARALRQDPSYAEGNYGIAYAYHMSGDQAKAFGHALKALDGFKDRLSKSDASMLAAISADAMNRPAEALTYYRKARELGRVDFLSAKKILCFSLDIEEETRWHEEAAALLHLDPHNLEYYYELLECFIDRGRGASIEKFLASYEAKRGKDGRARGNILLLKSAFFSKVVNDPAKRRDALKKAYAEFGKIFPESDEVMLMIKKELERKD
ncbi:MAG TPA: hypothetical protein PK573_14780 [Spirochaetota bacterium]|nr:hypothetical protein [Spirochaetota bacterium]